MNRKDYEAIAAMLRQHIVGGLTTDERTTAAAIAGALAGYFAQDNARFNVNRFLTACGAGGEVECIVVPGEDGPTLWDCPCRECRSIRADWAEKQS